MTASQHPNYREIINQILATRSLIEKLVMKVGIIGAGAVGSACALALVMRGAAREIVLVDRTRERARAVATDLRYGTPLSPAVDIQDGDFDSLAGAALVMITAGVNEKTGGATDRKDAAGRLKLLDTNRGIAIMCAESPGDLVLRYLSLLKAPQG